MQPFKKLYDYISSATGMNSKCVVVLGMHRTGSSALASMLNAMGVNMGTCMYGSDVGNPLGHFEDIDFLNVNEKILAAAGGDWRNPPSDFQIRVFGARHSNELGDILAQKQKNGLWGFKDPRTCLTLPLYFPRLISARFVVLNRPCMDIADSLYRRDGVKFHFRHDNEQLCFEYKRRVLATLEESKARHITRIEHSLLMNCPIKVAKILDKFIGLGLSKTELLHAASVIKR